MFLEASGMGEEGEKESQNGTEVSPDQRSRGSGRRSAKLPRSVKVKITSSVPSSPANPSGLHHPPRSRHVSHLRDEHYQLVTNGLSTKRLRSSLSSESQHVTHNSSFRRNTETGVHCSDRCWSQSGGTLPLHGRNSLGDGSALLPDGKSPESSHPIQT